MHYPTAKTTDQNPTTHRNKLCRKVQKRRSSIIKIVRLEAERVGREADLQIDFDYATPRLTLKSVRKTTDGGVDMSTFIKTDLTRDSGARLWKKMKRHFDEAAKQ